MSGEVKLGWIEAKESRPSDAAWYVTARQESSSRFGEENATFTLGRLNYPGGKFPSDAEVWIEIPPPPWLVEVLPAPHPETPDGEGMM